MKLVLYLIPFALLAVLCQCGDADPEMNSDGISSPSYYHINEELTEWIEVNFLGE